MRQGKKIKVLSIITAIAFLLSNSNICMAYSADTQKSHLRNIRTVEQGGDSKVDAEFGVKGDEDLAQPAFEGEGIIPIDEQRLVDYITALEEKSAGDPEITALYHRTLKLIATALEWYAAQVQGQQFDVTDCPMTQPGSMPQDIIQITKEGLSLFADRGIDTGALDNLIRELEATRADNPNFGMAYDDVIFYLRRIAQLTDRSPAQLLADAFPEPTEGEATEENVAKSIRALLVAGFKILQARFKPQRLDSNRLGVLIVGAEMVIAEIQAEFSQCNELLPQEGIDETFEERHPDIVADLEQFKRELSERRQQWLAKRREEGVRELRMVGEELVAAMNGDSAGAVASGPTAEIPEPGPRVPFHYTADEARQGGIWLDLAQFRIPDWAEPAGLRLVSNEELRVMLFLSGVRETDVLMPTGTPSDVLTQRTVDAMFAGLERNVPIRRLAAVERLQPYLKLMHNAFLGTLAEPLIGMDYKEAVNHNEYRQHILRRLDEAADNLLVNLMVGRLSMVREAAEGLVRQARGERVIFDRQTAGDETTVTMAVDFSKGMAGLLTIGHLNFIAESDEGTVIIYSQDGQRLGSIRDEGLCAAIHSIGTYLTDRIVVKLRQGQISIIINEGHQEVEHVCSFRDGTFRVFAHSVLGGTQPGPTGPITPDNNFVMLTQDIARLAVLIARLQSRPGDPQVALPTDEMLLAGLADVNGLLAGLGEDLAQADFDDKERTEERRLIVAMVFAMQGNFLAAADVINNPDTPLETFLAEFPVTSQGKDSTFADCLGVCKSFLSNAQGRLAFMDRANPLRELVEDFDLQLDYFVGPQSAVNRLAEKTSSGGLDSLAEPAELEGADTAAKIADRYVAMQQKRIDEERRLVVATLLAIRGDLSIAAELINNPDTDIRVGLVRLGLDFNAALKRYEIETASGYFRPELGRLMRRIYNRNARINYFGHVMLDSVQSRLEKKRELKTLANLVAFEELGGEEPGEAEVHEDLAQADFDTPATTEVLAIPATRLFGAIDLLEVGARRADGTDLERATRRDKFLRTVSLVAAALETDRTRAIKILRGEVSDALIQETGAELAVLMQRPRGQDRIQFDRAALEALVREAQRPEKYGPIIDDLDALAVRVSQSALAAAPEGAERPSVGQLTPEVVARDLLGEGTESTAEAGTGAATEALQISRNRLTGYLQVLEDKALHGQTDLEKAVGRETRARVINLIAAALEPDREGAIAILRRTPTESDIAQTLGRLGEFCGTVYNREQLIQLARDARRPETYNRIIGQLDELAVTAAPDVIRQAQAGARREARLAQLGKIQEDLAQADFEGAEAITQPDKAMAVISGIHQAHMDQKTALITEGKTVIIPRQLVPPEFLEELYSDIRTGDLQGRIDGETLVIGDVIITPLDEAITLAQNKVTGPEATILLDQKLSLDPRLSGPNLKARSVVLDNYDPLYLEGGIALARSVNAGNNNVIAAFYSILTGLEITPDEIERQLRQGRLMLHLPKVEIPNADDYRGLLKEAYQFLKKA